MSNALVSTLFHLLELAVVLLITFILVKFLHVDSATEATLIGLVLAGLAKFVRSNDAIPVQDYVNKSNE